MVTELLYAGCSDSKHKRLESSRKSSKSVEEGICSKCLLKVQAVLFKGTVHAHGNSDWGSVSQILPELLSGFWSVVVCASPSQCSGSWWGLRGQTPVCVWVCVVSGLLRSGAEGGGGGRYWGVTVLFITLTLRPHVGVEGLPVKCFTEVFYKGAVQNVLSCIWITRADQLLLIVVSKRALDARSTNIFILITE